MQQRRAIVLAYSGGLDTSFCLLHLVRAGWDVIAVTVDSGGFSRAQLEEAAARTDHFGAEHLVLDRREEIYSRCISWVIKGNILRGGVYPLCVAVERVTQALAVAQVAADRGCSAVAHGATAVGNDQVRFDAVLRSAGPDLDILAPIRDQNVSRERSCRELRAAGVKVSDLRATYSVNRSLWGVTIGGGDIQDPRLYPPADAWALCGHSAPLAECVDTAISFEAGLPVGLDGRCMGPLEIISTLNDLAGPYQVGRGVHLGDTVLGVKGRTAFDAPAALVLIRAHTELEKLLLTDTQVRLKSQLAETYGNALHQGRYLDPFMRDVEAFLDSSQRHVEGTVHVRISWQAIVVRGVDSASSLVDNEVAAYGESADAWNGADAAGFARIFPVQALIAARRTRRLGATSDEAASDLSQEK
ncbi:MAG: argininosuccinate synthase [Planctomycetota bacterium]